MNTKRKATRRDLPALCVIYGVIFAFAALALPFGARLDMAKRSELHSISGTVQDMSRTNPPKASPKLHILVKTGNRLHHLIQNDLSYDVPAVWSLRAGDNVTALVRRDFFGRNLEWVWEVQRDGVTILSYDQTQRFLEHATERTQCTTDGCLTVQVLARTYFGPGLFKQPRPHKSSQEVTRNGPDDQP